MAVVDETVTVTRQQLVDAIEAGIAAVEERTGPLLIEFAKLRQVGREAQCVAVGTYNAPVGCPVAQAFPGEWVWLGWDGTFTYAYDRYMRNLGLPLEHSTVEIVQ